MEALIEATTHDMEKAETAVLRMADDQYRKIIFNAQVYANTGAGTCEKALRLLMINAVYKATMSSPPVNKYIIKCSTSIPPK